MLLIRCWLVWCKLNKTKGISYHHYHSLKNNPALPKKSCNEKEKKKKPSKKTPPLLKVK